MERRRLLNLTSEYTLLNYIETDGDQWLNTHLKVNDWDEFEADIYLNQEIGPGYAQYNLCGSTAVQSPNANNSKVIDVRNNYQSGANPKKCMIWYATNYISGSSYVIPIQQWVNLKAVIKSGEQKMWHDGTQFINTAYSANLVNNYDCFLFGVNQGGKTPVDIYHLRGRCKTITFKLNGVNVRKYIPVIRIADNNVGFYDECGSICPITNSPFYVNEGSGNFIGG